MGTLLQAFVPTKVLSPGAMQVIVWTQVAIFLLVWLNSPFKILPRPIEVVAAFQHLWMQEGLGRELVSSLLFNLEALFISACISIGFAYLSVMPFFRPLVNALSKGRFLSLVGFTIVFTLALGGGHTLKLSLLVFGMSVFFITSMASVVAEIPMSDFDFARTLRMHSWRVVWEVVILGTADKALEVMRQNAAIGWMMLTMVEGLVRSEGGIGVMLLNQQKYMNLANVFAIQMTILFIGLMQDFGIGLLRRTLCPYAYLGGSRS